MSIPQAVVIGASAGAVEALSVLLPALPGDFPLPVMVVVHLPPDKKSLLTEIFKPRCQMDVREAEDKEPITGGTIYFAPTDYHLQVEKNFRLSLSGEEPVLFSRPSIDVLFETAADAYGNGLIGIILTGANHDGARGLRTVEDAGGLTVVQTPESAMAATMPAAALKLCANARAMRLDQIAAYLQKAISQ